VERDVLVTHGCVDEPPEAAFVVVEALRELGVRPGERGEHLADRGGNRPTTDGYGSVMRVVVISDTHVPDFAAALPPALLRAFEGADVILHAGDVTSPVVLDELSRFARPRGAGQQRC
jgi:hypothetical protein